MSDRSISDGALGKHIGHAVEAHCRGVLKQISRKEGWTLARSADLTLPVETDAVLTTADGKVRAIVIISYNSNSDDTERRIDHSSHKFYRTRLEFNEALRLFTEEPELFDPKFTVLTVIYGTRQGWKKQLLEELCTQCPPVLFCPDELGDSPAESIVSDAFELYEGSRSKRSEVVERHFSEVSLIDTHEKFQECVELALNNGWRLSRKAARRLPPVGGGAKTIAPFRSRLRQGLSLVSLFSDEETEAWKNRGRGSLSSASDPLQRFVRRALLLDLVKVGSSKSILGTTEVALVRRPYEGNDYSPHRPDFDDWSRVGLSAITEILGVHRALPLSSASFHAGGLDQVFGNLNQWVALSREALPNLAAAVKGRRKSKIKEVLTDNDGLICPENWHPCAAGAFKFLLPWSVAVSAVATVRESRAEFRRHEFRTINPDLEVVNKLVDALLDNYQEVAELIADAANFAVSINDKPFSALTVLDRPMLLDLEVPTSWIAAAYLTTTTNPSHNPIAVAARRWADLRGLHDIRGFPSGRGVPVSAFTENSDCRLEWTLGGEQKGGDITLIEVRSITANNIGNKSKEVFDRIAQTRAAVKAANRHVHLIGVLDGDFDQPQTLREFSSRIGYDEIISADQVIVEAFGVR